MKSQVSLTSVLAAVMLFAVTAAMHEAARADNLALPGYHQVAQRFVAQRGKKPLGLKSSGGTSTAEQCTHGTNDITVCSDCDPDGVCVVTRCVDGRTGDPIDCNARP
jgi:hypothetical protein